MKKNITILLSSLLVFTISFFGCYSEYDEEKSKDSALNSEEILLKPGENSKYVAENDSTFIEDGSWVRPKIW